MTDKKCPNCGNAVDIIGNVQLGFSSVACHAPQESGVPPQGQQFDSSFGCNAFSDLPQKFVDDHALSDFATLAVSLCDNAPVFVNDRGMQIDGLPGGGRLIVIQ